VDDHRKLAVVFIVLAFAYGSSGATPLVGAVSREAVAIGTNDMDSAGNVVCKMFEGDRIAIARARETARVSGDSSGFAVDTAPALRHATLLSPAGLDLNEHLKAAAITNALLWKAYAVAHPDIVELQDHQKLLHDFSESLVIVTVRGGYPSLQLIEVQVSNWDNPVATIIHKEMPDGNFQFRWYGHDRDGEAEQPQFGSPLPAAKAALLASATNELLNQASRANQDLLEFQGRHVVIIADMNGIHWHDSTPACE